MILEMHIEGLLVLIAVSFLCGALGGYLAGKNSRD